MLNSLIQSFAENSERNAFCINDQFYSYKELRNHVLQIRQQIVEINKGATRKNIAIVCSNDIRTYASLFAIWISGCAYVPLGLHNPVDRNITILENAEVEVIISTVELDDPKYSFFKIVRPRTSAEERAEAINCPSIDDEALAYILFTSGSTGLPKGVSISHGNLFSFIKAFSSSPFVITRDDRCLQMFELTFDVSISSYLPALLKGACVYTVPNDGIKYMHVLRVMTQYALTSIQIVPSIIKLAKPILGRVNLPEVRNCILTGEATSSDLITIWKPRIPNARIFNFYGPTESTIYCSYLQYSDEHPKFYNGMMAIGKAFDGTDLLIVGEDGEETGVNEKGELLIGGGQLTPGYINNAEKNRTSFLERTSNNKTIRFYRSGDLCYRDKDGDLFYCGRLDNQVKIQGFRIELSEIEFLVRDKFGINSVVIVSENEQGASKLILVLEGQRKAELNPVVSYLKNKLPEYMLPTASQAIDEFPLNSSGKTDRKKIKELLNEHT